MWYFLPILAFGIAPWLLAFGFASKNIFKKGAPVEGFDASLFLWLWVALVFVFFSVSGSKLPSYILPIFPSLALLVGHWLAEARPRRLLAAQAGLAALVGVGI